MNAIFRTVKQPNSLDATPMPMGLHGRDGVHQRTLGQRPVRLSRCGVIAIIVEVAANRGGKNIEIHPPNERHVSETDERQAALGRALEVGIKSQRGKRATVTENIWQVRNGTFRIWQPVRPRGGRRRYRDRRGALRGITDHSSFTLIQQRLGIEVFQRLFEQVVDLCQEAGLVRNRSTARRL